MFALNLVYILSTDFVRAFPMLILRKSQYLFTLNLVCVLSTDPVRAFPMLNLRNSFVCKMRTNIVRSVIKFTRPRPQRFIDANRPCIFANTFLPRCLQTFALARATLERRERTWCVKKEANKYWPPPICIFTVFIANSAF